MGRRMLVVGITGAVAAAFALTVSAGALGRASAVDHLTLTTQDVAVPAAVKVKKVPVCKKGQKSTRKKPCRKRRTRALAVRANPPLAGWAFRLSVGQNADGTWALTMSYLRTAGSVSESHTYAFQLAPGSVTVAQDLSSFALDTGTQLAQFGTIKMSLAKASGLSQGTAPAGCTTGTWQTRTGSLTGSLTFVADGTYFKALKEASLPVGLVANTSGTPAVCGSPPAPGCAHGTGLFTNGGAAGSAFASLRDGAVTVSVGKPETIAPAKIFHVLLVANLPASDLTAAPDLSTGAIATAGASPALTGALTFTAGAPETTFLNSACGTNGAFSQGTVSGTLTAKFAAIPAVTPSSGSATLETF